MPDSSEAEDQPPDEQEVDVSVKEKERGVAVETSITDNLNPEECTEAMNDPTNKNKIME